MLTDGAAIQDSAISVADTVYINACAGLVLFMTPGLALFYGGMVRERAAVDMMLQNFVSMGILSVLWYLIGFSMSFAPGPVIGDLRHLCGFDVSRLEPWPETQISQQLFCNFQMMFAIITPILMTGAFADRMRFGPYCLFIVLWSVLVYYPWCHQIWGGGFFQQIGVWDFAGGIVVHTTAGWSSLASVICLRPRKAKAEGWDIAEPHNLPMVLTGTGILWFGWFGFNGGSSLTLNEVAVTAMTNSHMSAAMAMCVWGLLDRIKEGKFKLLPLCIACVAGLVVVTPCCGLVQPDKAVLIGTLAGTMCYAAVWFLGRIGVDDALDVWGVHGVGGAIGTVLIGILSDGPECMEDSAPEYCVNPGSVARSPQQALLQATALITCVIYSFMTTWFILSLIALYTPILPEESHFDCLDDHLHGEKAYQYEFSADAAAPAAEQVPEKPVRYV